MFANPAEFFNSLLERIVDEMARNKKPEAKR